MLVRTFGRLIPFLVVIVVLLALYQLYAAFLLAAQKNYSFAVFSALFGFAGFVLARTLWSHRKTFRPPAP